RRVARPDAGGVAHLPVHDEEEAATAPGHDRRAKRMAVDRAANGDARARAERLRDVVRDRHRRPRTRTAGTLERPFEGVHQASRTNGRGTATAFGVGRPCASRFRRLAVLWCVRRTTSERALATQINA